ncbi:unnamed protein product [Caenorhabditis angaria]|uniref:Uncharacterized protein n=1 Tax=Caenorhabditis angaria TaxID=860376 RepID=A0A9P1IFD0_9PELO|nr:unnamed protein product [Caenorhabditis angaria]
MDPKDRKIGRERLFAFRHAAKLGLRDEMKSLLDPFFIVHKGGSELKDEEAIDFLMENTKRFKLVFASPNGATDVEIVVKNVKMIFDFDDEGEQKLRAVYVEDEYYVDGTVNEAEEEEEEDE